MTGHQLSARQALPDVCWTASPHLAAAGKQQCVQIRLEKTKKQKEVIVRNLNAISRTQLSVVGCLAGVGVEQPLLAQFFLLYGVSEGRFWTVMFPRCFPGSASELQECQDDSVFRVELGGQQMMTRDLQLWGAR